jgi:nickel-dependent lactate racemase
MHIEMPYGDRVLSADAPWLRLAGTIDVADVPELTDCDSAIAGAIESPIGLDRNVYEIVRPGERIAIIVSDSFRRTAVDRVLPVLLDGLNRRGVSEKDICFIFASGTHRPPTPAEQSEILGDSVYARFQTRAFTHDPNDKAKLVTIGTTRRGTVVEINRTAWECDRIIATGAVVMHYFGGFGGGRKSIVPGISSAETIAHNHAMNLDPIEDKLNPAVRIAVMEGNPVAEDMLEASRFAGVEYIINTVLNRDGKIAGIFAGELETAHRAAAAFAQSIYSVRIDAQADVVIAASPDTRNFVQTHKALYNAFQAMKPGGRIVLIAPCREGLGGERFVKWLRLGSPKAVIAGLRKASEINGQTALSTLEKAPSCIMITELERGAVESLGAVKAQDLGDALARVQSYLVPVGSPDCYLMPSAAYTVPFLKELGNTAAG